MTSVEDRVCPTRVEARLRGVWAAQVGCRWVTQGGRATSFTRWLRAHAGATPRTSTSATPNHARSAGPRVRVGGCGFPSQRGIRLNNGLRRRTGMSSHSLTQTNLRVIDGDLEEVARHGLTEAMQERTTRPTECRRLHHNPGLGRPASDRCSNVLTCARIPAQVESGLHHDLGSATVTATVGRHDPSAAGEGVDGPLATGCPERRPARARPRRAGCRSRHARRPHGRVDPRVPRRARP